MKYNKPGGQTEHTDIVFDADFRLRRRRYKYPTVPCNTITITNSAYELGRILIQADAGMVITRCQSFSAYAIFTHSHSLDN